MFAEQLTLEDGSLTKDLELLNRYVDYLMNCFNEAEDNAELTNELMMIQRHVKQIMVENKTPIKHNVKSAKVEMLKALKYMQAYKTNRSYIYAKRDLVMNHILYNLHWSSLVGGDMISPCKKWQITTTPSSYNFVLVYNG